MRSYLLSFLTLWVAACDPDTDGDGIPSSEDCDDDNAEIYPDQAENCDGIDNNCDGAVDEGVLTLFYADVDGDGFGDATKPFERCEIETGLVADNTDCDDSQSAAKPGGVEICDDIDNDCDTEVDEDATDAPTWFRDEDGDKFGDDNETLVVCDPGDGWVDVGGDCNDVNKDVHPSMDEVCNKLDDDCKDGIDGPDAIDARTWYQDRDGDTYGDASSIETACERPSGYVDDDQDCNDYDKGEKPGVKWYPDVDRDTYGANVPPNECGRKAGTDVLNNRDCDDADATVNPGAKEIWYDGFDQDCNGGSDYDQDGDTYDSVDYEGEDCDDGNPTIKPGASETRNGADEDCDGLCDEGVLSSGDLVITEIMDNPAAVGDGSGEWFEVYNPTKADLVLCDGWSLTDDSGETHDIAGPITIRGLSYYVFGNNSDTMANGGVTVNYEYSDYTLGNSADTVRLEFDGTVIDEVVYDTSLDNWTILNDDGASKQVDYDYMDAKSNDDSYYWCHNYDSILSGGDYGTPGTDNDYCYAES
jgi:hypothetical protein